MDRRSQNRAAKTWKELKATVDALDPLIVPVLLRGTFESGVRKDPKALKSDPMVGDAGKFLSGPSYADPTGEEAVRTEIADRVANAIDTIAKNVTVARNFAHWIIQGVPATTDEAILREIPSCLGCDRPVFGRVKSGYDQECYDRKRYLKITDRAEFRRARLAELAESEVEQSE